MSVAGSLSFTVPSRSSADTQAVAARLLPLLAPGDLILLGGELGAGKTTFTQGLARAMGITEPVTSPTFTLMRTYEPAGPGGHRQGAFRLLHADLYRLENLQEIVDLGLGEWLDEAMVAVVEWGDAGAAVLRPEYLEVRIDFGAGDDDRTITLKGVGPQWAGRMPKARQVVGG